jgi:hypothetical protein
MQVENTSEHKRQNINRERGESRGRSKMGQGCKKIREHRENY